MGCVPNSSEPERTRRFEGLFASYGADVVAYCGWRAGSPSDAQDAVAEVFLVAWRRLDAVPQGDAARVWLYGTARRVIANQRRSDRRRAALRERLTHQAAEAVSQDPSLGREASLVREALQRLSQRDREVLLLAEWEGLTPPEIARVLGCLVVTARGRLHRARRRLRVAFEQLDRPEDERPERAADGRQDRFHVLRPAALAAQPSRHLREGGP